eukprot:TRINITY_DN5444_c0_g1_i7.p1 TRINITY_DN5444_c0_g1~~TRINITY_DN5444_c0_g1_i7.p1  ORF type:complete len:359 (-),score=-11.00 TRINITY_DN5444_c0_g1_i7:41-1117(-)
MNKTKIGIIQNIQIFLNSKRCYKFLNFHILVFPTVVTAVLFKKSMKLSIEKKLNEYNSKHGFLPQIMKQKMAHFDCRNIYGQYSPRVPHQYIFFSEIFLSKKFQHNYIQKFEAGENCKSWSKSLQFLILNKLGYFEKLIIKFCGKVFRIITIIAYQKANYLVTRNTCNLGNFSNSRQFFQLNRKLKSIFQVYKLQLKKKQTQFTKKLVPKLNTATLHIVNIIPIHTWHIGNSSFWDNVSETFQETQKIFASKNFSGAYIQMQMIVQRSKNEPIYFCLKFDVVEYATRTHKSCLTCDTNLPPHKPPHAAGNNFGVQLSTQYVRKYFLDVFGIDKYFVGLLIIFCYKQGFFFQYSLQIMQ